MSVLIRTERRNQRADRRGAEARGLAKKGSVSKPEAVPMAVLKSAHRYYLYHNNSKAFHEILSGMRIGRNETSDNRPHSATDAGQVIRVDDSLVSKEHCRLWIQGSALYVEDLGTVNATRVNSVPMQPGARRKVLLHDVIEVGGQRFILTQQNRRPPAFTEDLTRRKGLPYRARRKSDGSLTAVFTGEIFQETLVAVDSAQYRELRLRSAVKSAGHSVRSQALRPTFRALFWLGISLISFLVFLFVGSLHPLNLI